VRGGWEGEVAEGVSDEDLIDGLFSPSDRKCSKGFREDVTQAF
jgi:hypothetical protein